MRLLRAPRYRVLVRELPEDVPEDLARLAAARITISTADRISWLVLLGRFVEAAFVAYVGYRELNDLLLGKRVGLQ